jgi:hypothetical protein
MHREREIFEMSTKTIRLGVATLLLVLAMPAVSLGQAARESYNTPAGTIQEDVGGQPQGIAGTSGDGVAGTAPTGDGGSALPFTGLDIALLIGAGGVFLVAGLGMRRLARSPDPA